MIKRELRETMQQELAACSLSAPLMEINSLDADWIIMLKHNRGVEVAPLFLMLLFSVSAHRSIKFCNFSPCFFSSVVPRHICSTSDPWTINWKELVEHRKSSLTSTREQNGSSLRLQSRRTSAAKETLSETALLKTNSTQRCSQPDS